MWEVERTARKPLQPLLLHARSVMLRSLLFEVKLAVPSSVKELSLQLLLPSVWLMERPAPKLLQMPLLLHAGCILCSTLKCALIRLMAV